MNKLIPASFALAMALPMAATHAQTPAAAETAADIKALRQEMEAMRSAYEARMQALEQRLRSAEASATAAAKPAAAANTNAAPTAAATSAVAAAPVNNKTAGANAFNPAISLILSGTYANTSQDPENYGITGFHLPTDGEFGPGTRGLSLAESELGISAQIDPFWRGALHLALHPDNQVSVEEAYVQTTALGHGLTAKAGRFLSGVGSMNSQHAHTWDFVDNALAYQALLGGQYGDDGLQLKWLAPLNQYLELGAEIGRGRSHPGTDTSRNKPGMWALTAKTGGDIGESHSWRLGASLLNAKASAQELVGLNAAGESVHSAFDGDTQVWVLDAIWKWAPNGNATRTNFKLQGEYLQSRRKGSLLYAADSEAASSGDYRATLSGWYVQGVYQFMPAWRVGLRTERLDAGRPDYGLNSDLYAQSRYKPAKHSLMLDYSPSEFSRIRLQLAQDRSREGVSDRQLMLQYQMSLGAHGAHGY